jgi:phi LC3 family holin
MNKINLKVRFRNPMFIAQLIASIFIPILAYAGLTAQDLTSWPILGGVLLNAISNPYVLMLVVLSVYNTLVDPTTNGFKDSSLALRYEKPKKG